MYSEGLIICIVRDSLYVVVTVCMTCHVLSHLFMYASFTRGIILNEREALYIHTYIHIHTYTHTLRMYIHTIHIYVHRYILYTYIRMYIHILYTYIYIYTYIHTYTQIRACLEHMHTYTYMYGHALNTHTHTHTDLAARGIDVQGLPYVVNVTLPDSKENYIHRIGRVGRADRYVYIYIYIYMCVCVCVCVCVCMHSCKRLHMFVE